MQQARTACIPSAPGYVPGIYIRKLLQMAQHAGADRAHFRNLVPRFVPGSDDSLDALEFTYAEYLRFVAETLEFVDDDAAGLAFGTGFGIKEYGILGYAMLSCRDLRQCLQTFQNLNDLFGELAELERAFYWTEHEVTYRCVSYLVNDPVKRFELQVPLAQFMTLKTLLADPGGFRVSRVLFEFPAPADTQPYEALFGTRVQFDADTTELSLPLELLDAPFALGNQEAWEACEHQCERLCRGMHESGVLTERVRQIALRSPGEIPELDAIARQLNVSSRTLRRRLAEEQTSYQEIVADVREHLARRYLSETNLAIKEVAFLLGYSEVANFQRAFKKRVGLTPGAYRAGNHAA